MKLSIIKIFALLHFSLNNRGVIPFVRAHPLLLHANVIIMDEVALNVFTMYALALFSPNASAHRINNDDHNGLCILKILSFVVISLFIGERLYFGIIITRARRSMQCQASSMRDAYRMAS
jgi:hypothetical protein